MFGKLLDEFDMYVVYDVLYNIVKFEEYIVDGEMKMLFVYCKGSMCVFLFYYLFIFVDY